MKYSTILFFFVISTFQSTIFAQENTFVNILEEPQFIQMDARPLSNKCDNKAVIPVLLPKDTKGWYYEISIASKGSKMDEGDELLVEVQQLSKKIPFDQINDHIELDQTNRNANIYILRGKKNADAFSNCGYYMHHGKYIESKSKGGFIEYSEGETYYLGIERNSDWKGLKVKVELVAML